MTSLAFNHTGDWVAGETYILPPRLGANRKRVRDGLAGSILRQMSLWWCLTLLGVRQLPPPPSSSSQCLLLLPSTPPSSVGCAKLGQLLVWEWRSDTYVLKQQGHYFDISAVAFSPDGALVATGSDDRKVRR